MSARACALAVAALFAGVPPAAAQSIRSDASWGRTAQTLSGPNYAIPESMGRVAGRNLFHSFQTFGLASGEAARFSTTTPTLANVLTRVTGGSPSTIRGNLRLDAAPGSAPDFYLINPAGVTFGKGASVDVPAAFHVSTANSVRFADGSQWQTAQADNVLSAAAPEAFGFLAGARKAIVVGNGAEIVTAGDLSLTAGDIVVRNGRIEGGSGWIDLVAVGDVGTTTQIGRPPASAAGGILVDGGASVGTVASAAGAGPVTLRADTIRISGQDTVLGSITLAGGGNAGDIDIAGRSVSIADGAKVVSLTAAGSTGHAGTLWVGAGAELTVSGGALLSTSSTSAGNAGAIVLAANEISIDGATVQSEANDSGHAGNIELRAGGGTVNLHNDATISSSTAAAGNAGIVSLSGRSLLVDSGASIVSGTARGSTGAGGSVDVDFTDSVRVESGGMVLTSTLSSSDAGPLSIRAEQVWIRDKGSLVDSSTQGAGRAGSVSIRAGSVTVDDSALVSSLSFGTNAGPAGEIEIVARDTLRVSGGTVASSTFSASPAGSVDLAARDIVVDGGTISSSTTQGSTGDAGVVRIVAGNSLTMKNSSRITSSTVGRGNAGGILIEAADIDLASDALITSQAAPQSTGGNGGIVSVKAANTISIRDKASIDSSTFAAGNAGMVSVSARDILIDGEETGITSSAIGSGSTTGNAGGVTIVAGGSLSLANRGIIDSSTLSGGAAGTVDIHAANVSLASGSAIRSISKGSTAGPAGEISIEASGTVGIGNLASIASSTFSNEPAGSVAIRTRELVMDGGVVKSQAEEGSTGAAGAVRIEATGTARFLNESFVSSSTLGTGNAGGIAVSAGDLTLDGASRIVSQAAPGSRGGDAGPVSVTAGNQLTILGQSDIDSSTYASGNAGSVTVGARNILIDGKETGITSSAAASATGSAGSVTVVAGDRLDVINSGLIDSSTLSPGSAGTVSVTAETIRLDQGALLTSVSLGQDAGPAGQIFMRAGKSIQVENLGAAVSSTFSGSPAGSINITTRDLAVDGGVIMSQAEKGSSGPAGVVQIAASGELTMRNSGVITSSTLSRGDAGAVSITAGRVAVDRSYIASVATDTSTGNAGGVSVIADDSLLVRNGGAISTTTRSPFGKAGTVFVKARDILLTGSHDDTGSSIASEAGADSSGLTGQMAIVAERSLTLSDEAVISVRNNSTATPSGAAANDLVIQAPRITLTRQAEITSESSQSFPADNIYIAVSDILSLDRSSITTQANNGNGGGIFIGGGTKVVRLQNSALTTSVIGTAGNGGDILVRSGALILDTGFVQANTAAADASGGNVRIEVKDLLPSGNSLRVGGNTPYTFAANVFGFNVIQAAAPTGLSGNITISAPPTDISGSLAELDAPALDLGAFGRDPCSRSAGSSLTTPGRGALPAGPGGFLSPAGGAVSRTSGAGAAIPSPLRLCAL